MSKKKILNKTDTADFLGVSRRTVYTWQKKGYGPKFTKTPTGSEVTTREKCEQFLAELS